MPGPLAKGVVIVASVLVAASIAVYENPQFREWIERSSQKVAVAFRSLGDDIHGRRRPSRGQDPSMHEDADEKAEQRRRQAREEIIEKGRAMQERRKKDAPSTNVERIQSFDSMVDRDGKLKNRETETEQNPWAAASGMEHGSKEGLRSRNEHPRMHESVDAPILLRQLETEQRSSSAIPAIEPWESQYEQEMRNAWNIDLPARPADITNSHASESLIDLTPTTDDFPDPDYSVPSLDQLPHLMSRSEYFSAAASQTSQTRSDEQRRPYDDVSSQPIIPIEPRPLSPHENHAVLPSPHASLAGSTAHIGYSEAEFSDDDMSDEHGDGIRTPASAWTEVASSVSGDD